MAAPIGMPSEEISPGVWTGVTPEGVQRVLGSMFMNSGIVPGKNVTVHVQGTTSWAYKVPALTVFMWTSYNARTGILVPVEAETVPTSAPAAGTSRTDVIYVSTDGIVRVAQGAVQAPEGVEIDRMVIPAGATNTSSATSNWDTRFAIPAGASLGRLAQWTDPGGGAAGMAEVTRYAGRFHVPTDRLVRVDFNATLKSATSTPGHMGLIVVIDGVWRRAMSVSHTTDWTTHSASWTTGVLEGSHTIEVLTRGNSGGTWQFTTGESETSMSLWDMGVDD